MVLVCKKDGSWRLCLDYRGLKKAKVKDKFSIYIIEELMEELVGSNIYSKIDLRLDYHRWPRRTFLRQLECRHK